MVSVLGVPKTSLMLDDSLAVLTKLRSCCIRGMVYYSKKKKKSILANRKDTWDKNQVQPGTSFQAFPSSRKYSY